jgi:hypothetical protein
MSPAIRALYESQPWCFECDGALVLEHDRWRCCWCHRHGTYAPIQHRGRRFRALVVERGPAP